MVFTIIKVVLPMNAGGIGMKELIGLHHIALHTKNTDRSIVFYKAFGAEIVDQTDRKSVV